ncbi:MAG: M90 family metallopeptidase [Pseudomonadota bacterium]
MLHLAILASIIVFAVLFSVLQKRLRRARNEKLFNTPLEPSFVTLLRVHVPLYTQLPQNLRDELHGHINIFLHRKNFIGKGGVEITNKIRLVVAGNACLLLLQGNDRQFKGFSSILIYPETYEAPNMQHDGFVVSGGTSRRAGESWMRGPIVLSWTDVLSGSVDDRDGHNVVIHEFAHKLDEQSGHMNGQPLLNHDSHYEEWAKVLSEEYEALHKRAKRGKNRVLDAYGTVSPAEFFAVATESFFEKPVQMKKRLPELYEQLQTYYRVDPVSWRHDA